MTFANNLDLDKAQQNVGLYLGSKLYGMQIKYQQIVNIKCYLFQFSKDKQI